MYIRILIGIALFALAGCGFEKSQSSQQESERIRTDIERVWVYMQINVPYNDDNTDTFWYYGQIPRDTYNKMANNSVEEGFFQLRNIHYYSSDDDTIKRYQDDDDEGNIVFRIEHVARVNELKRPPIVGKDESQFEEVDVDTVKAIIEDIDATAGESLEQEIESSTP